MTAQRSGDPRDNARRDDGGDTAARLPADARDEMSEAADDLPSIRVRADAENKPDAYTGTRASSAEAAPAPVTPPAIPEQRSGSFARPAPPGAESGNPWPGPAPLAEQPPVSAPGRPAPPPQQPYNPYDTSAWRVPPGPNSPPAGPHSGAFPAQQPPPPQPPRPSYSGQFPAAPPAPGQPPQGAYSGQFPAQPPGPNQPPAGPYSGQIPIPPPPRQSGAFPATSQEQLTRSGAFAVPPDVTRSGQFPPPAAGATPDERRSGRLPAVPGPSSLTTSGRMPQGPYVSGPMRQIPSPHDAMQRSGQFPYPDAVTRTGGRPVIAAPGAAMGSVLTDWPALGFLLAALLLCVAMIAYIALRYSHFPDHIAMHFGPAGANQPDRIGEKRELWTIPFIAGIVLVANLALAWAVYRFDRFAARLLTLGGALVGAVAWVVLLTLLHR